MKHIKTLNTQTLNHTVKKKADAASARHHASQHVRHLVLFGNQTCEQKK